METNVVSSITNYNRRFRRDGDEDTTAGNVVGSAGGQVDEGTASQSWCISDRVLYFLVDDHVSPTFVASYARILFF